MISEQVRHATRSISRAKLFSTAMVATVALAAGTATTVYDIFNAVLLRPVPYPQADRLVDVWVAFPGFDIPLAPQSMGTYLSYRRSSRAFEDLGMCDAISATIVYSDPAERPERVRAAVTTGSTFSVLGARPVVGRFFTREDEEVGARPVAVIDERLWHSRFGGARTVVGATIVVDGVQREIVGVAPTTLAYPEAETRLWVPFVIDLSSPYLGTFAHAVIGRLRPGVTLRVAQRELQQILMRTPETYPQERPGVGTAALLAQARATVSLHRMRDDIIGGFGRVLWLLMATVVVLVAVACSNVAALLLVRFDAREREVAVRSALGAPASTVWAGLAWESGVLVFVGGTLGLMVAACALRFVSRTGLVEIPRANEIHADAAFFLAALLIAALFACVGMLIPLYHLAATDLGGVLREAGRAGTGGRTRQRWRSSFVAVQVAMALVLLAGSVVLGRSLARLRDVQLGFKPGLTLTFWTSLPSPSYRSAAAVAQFYRETLAAIRAVPGVRAAGAVSKLPLEVDGTFRRLVWVEDALPHPGTLPAAYQVASATSAYFQVMRIPVIAGRSFDDARVIRGVNEAVVSQGFAARYWHDATGRAALGRRIKVAETAPWYTIVGVVRDIRDSSLTAPAIAAVYLPEEASPDSVVQSRTQAAMAFVVRTRDRNPRTPELVEGAVRGIDEAIPVYRVRWLTDVVAHARGRLVFGLVLITAAAAMTLTLAFVGLYGVVAYLTSLRSREIGIRIALGLSPGRATRMMVVQGCLIAGIGIGAGLVLFGGFSRLLASLVYSISTADPASLSASLLGVLLVSILATWLPARRAARVDPMEALRHE